jgi:hypothetical protein
MHIATLPGLQEMQAKVREQLAANDTCQVHQVKLGAQEARRSLACGCARLSALLHLHGSTANLRRCTLGWSRQKVQVMPCERKQ